MLTGLVFFLGNSISSGIPIVLEALDLYHASTDSPHLAFASGVSFNGSSISLYSICHAWSNLGFTLELKYSTDHPSNLLHCSAVLPLPLSLCKGSVTSTSTFSPLALSHSITSPTLRFFQ